jgi:FkbM family methyltransferase
MRRMAKFIRKEDIVIDLGAHIGLGSIEFAHVGRHVYAFEPNPDNFAKLRRNTRKYSNITVFEQAVSNESGKTQLYFEPKEPEKYFEGATIIKGKSNIGYDRFVEVDAISADDVLKMIEGPVALIKMDIEGAEYRVLDALIKSGQMDRIGKVYVECHADRIPELAGPKKSTLALARRAGVVNKLDFTWP